MEGFRSPRPKSKRSDKDKNKDKDSDLESPVVQLMNGKYTRIERIGSGSFAKVYQGIHNKRRSFVAIKSVDLHRLNPRLRDNLRSEIDILKNIRHPHIVALIDCEETPTHMHLIMEFCALGDLSHFIRKRHSLGKHELTADMIAKYPNPPNGGLNEVLVRHLLKQLACALHFLRSHDIIHRDLKPQNLLLNPPLSAYAKGLLRMPYKMSEDSFTPLVGVDSLPMLKIADFGFARSLPSTSMAETLCGSPLYMAPEILRYEKYDAKADLWSVGAVLFEMIFGKPPFLAGNHVELLRLIESTNDKIKLPSDVKASDPIKRFIRKLLKRHPVERLNFKDFFESSFVRDDIPGLVGEDLQAQLDAKQRDSLRDKTEGGQARYYDDRAPPNSEPSQGVTTPRPLSGNFARPAATTAVRRVGSRETDLQRVAVAARRNSGTPQSSSPRQHALREAMDSQKVGATKVSPTSSQQFKNYNRVGEDALSEQEREQAAQDVAFERDYVVVEKRAVEVNAFADELAASPRFGQQQQQFAGKQSGAIVRRATTTATPQPRQPSQDASSRAVQVVSGRPSPTSGHYRHSSYDRRYGTSPVSARSAISKALNKATGRLFGVSLSPPLSLTKAGRSPPSAYNPFPTYPLAQSNLLVVGDGAKISPPLDEDTKTIQIIEECATRSDVVYGFAEVKYKQLVPLAPSMRDPGFKPRQTSGENDAEDPTDSGLTVDAVFTLSEEALVLYVKALSLLAKSMDIAGAWWVRKNRGEAVGNGSSFKGDNLASIAVGQRVNNVVQWVRNRFNEVLQKAEYSRLRLMDAQKQLPPSHPGHRDQRPDERASSGINIADQVIVTSGVNAERLMYDRALEMSRTAAINELTGEDLPGCEIAYLTAMRMLEAVLESDELPPLKDRRAEPAESGQEGMNEVLGEDSEVVIKLVASIRARLTALRKKIALMAKRTSAPPAVRGLAPHLRPGSPVVSSAPPK